jgi:protein-S-isoprenylcysteine O-methyltransferase Ste14
MRAWFTGLRALVYMTGFILLWVWLALGARRFDPLIGLTLPDWFGSLGVLIMVAGGALVLTCVGLFVGRGRGTPAPFDPPREFVAAGPYEFVRNPMYIGGLTVLVGFGLWQRSMSILLFALLVALVVHLFVVLFEEPDLERRFDGSYINYKRSVNRWLPKWPVRRLSSR